jgi:glucan phosphoethanolaminetransferase (alkaline phosphatase superfamily)
MALSPDFIIGVLSLLFTILILSYAVGDNPAFRLAIHAFIGIAAGYVAAIVLLDVIENKMVLPLYEAFYTGNYSSEEILVVVPALILGLFLLTKLSSRFEWMGRPVVALLVGIGAAAAVAGALIGTIYPQLAGSINMFDPSKDPISILRGLFILLGTVATLAYFQFTVFGKKASVGKRGVVFDIIALVGQIFIAITLGTLFAGVFSAALSALVDRIESIILFIEYLLPK